MKLSALQNISYGLYVVGAYCDGKPAGCIVNTCFQVTSEDPAIAVCLNKKNFTLEAIKQSTRFSVSIVAEDTDPAIIGRFGFSSGADKYAGFGYDDIDGAPAVRGRFCGRLILDAFNFIDCGTHVIVLGRLADSRDGEGRPMTYSYYHTVIKGKEPATAPTYRQGEKQASENESSHIRRFECDVCGYVAECDGDLPEDYICPICGVDRSHFFEITE